MLRPVGGADLDALWRLLTDPQMRRYLCDDRVLTRPEVETMLGDIDAAEPTLQRLAQLRLRTPTPP